MPMEERSRWTMHWDEVSVFDGNAVSLGVEEIDLMRSAGESLAREASAMTTGMVLFLCGPGNNGGDGFVAACSESLSGRSAVVASRPNSNTDASSQARSIAEESPGVHVWPSRPDGDWGLVVDCLLGAGGGGPGSSLRGPISEMSDWARSLGAPVLACDIPTGLGGPDCIPATRTLTFHSTKSGMDPGDCGEILVSDLPWPPEIQDCGPGDSQRYPSLEPGARKGDRGRLLVIGGGPYHGAPILSGMAAARSGCDLVHVAMPSKAASRCDWPTSIIPEELPDGDFLTMSSTASIEAIIQSGRRPDSIVIGPGLGREERTIEAVQAILEMATERGIPIVVDADAIGALPRGKWPRGMTGVATPHEAEASRWLGEAEPHEALSECLEEGSTIVITGPEDRLTGPSGRNASARGGHPRMAVGGTGDLLAGAIGGLLAQGMSPWPAARLGCALLREAGERAAGEKGPGLLAEDIPVHIAHTLSDWTGSA